MPTTTTTTSIDPVTRLEGHLKIEVTIATDRGAQMVVDAKATGTLFRGIETILQKRPPLDAPDITQRICGVCPVSHGMASVTALDAAARTQLPNNARIMRNLVLGANYVQSHILHFYHLALQDFIDGPAMPPWQPSWSADKRVTRRPPAPWWTTMWARSKCAAKRTRWAPCSAAGSRIPPPTYPAASPPRYGRTGSTGLRLTWGN
jgi:hydrogenase large subunit